MTITAGTLAAVFLATLATPQTRALLAGPSKEGSSVLRAVTRLVEVNVVVESRNGQPVEGLTQNDFTVLDEGKPQEIKFFSVQSSRPMAGHPLPPLPPGTFSNRQEGESGVPPSVTVILLDGLNTHFEDQAYARRQIIKFLGQVRPEDRTALYTLDTTVHVLHDFTTDSRVLVAALHDYVGQESHQVKASEPAPEPVAITVITPNAPNASGIAPIEVGLENYLRQTQQQSADWYSMDRTLRTLDALKTIARRMSLFPGRKSLIWVSSSFPFTIGSGTANAENVLRGQRSFGAEIEKAERLMNDANMAIYPVDARGLVGTFGVNTNLSAQRSLPARQPQDNPTIEGLGQLTPTHDVMQVIADETGGRAFYGTNDIMGAIRRALSDSTLTYTLGYYPSEVSWDGRFREIKVKVRKSGIRVLSRRGYYALPEDTTGGNAKEHQLALMEAATEPLDATAIGLTVQTVSPSSKDVLPLTVGIDTHSLLLVQQDGRWDGSVEILFAQLDPKGAMLSGLRQPVHLHLTNEDYAALLKKGLRISGNLQLVVGTEKLRVVALDDTSSAVGSVTVALPPPATASQKAKP